MREGVVLGPIAEQQLRRTLAISQGDASVLVESPFSIVVLSFCALVLVVPLVFGLNGRRAPAVESSAVPGEVASESAPVVGAALSGATHGNPARPSSDRTTPGPRGTETTDNPSAFSSVTSRPLRGGPPWPPP